MLTRFRLSCGTHIATHRTVALHLTTIVANVRTVALHLATIVADVRTVTLITEIAALVAVCTADVAITVAAIIVTHSLRRLLLSSVIASVIAFSCFKCARHHHYSAEQHDRY
jgi:hypothetical protein